MAVACYEKKRTTSFVLACFAFHFFLFCAFHSFVYGATGETETCAFLISVPILLSLRYRTPPDDVCTLSISPGFTTFHEIDLHLPPDDVGILLILPGFTAFYEVNLRFTLAWFHLVVTGLRRMFTQRWHNQSSQRQNIILR